MSYTLLTAIVDLEAYPDYLGIVGGEDKMMDLGTIQTKIDNEEYRSIDEFQVSYIRRGGIISLTDRRTWK
jgi:hypothetical protein